MALTKRVYVDGETIITAQNLNDIQDEIISQEANKVPNTRTVNGKALSSNITLSASDVGAAPISHASTATTYGKGTSSNYGHIKLTDSLIDTTTAATGGLALSAKAGSDLKGMITHYVNRPLWFTIGSINSDGSSSTSTTRARTGLLYSGFGASVSCAGSVEYRICTYTSGEVFVGWLNNDFTQNSTNITSGVYFKILARYTDSRTISDVQPLTSLFALTFSLNERQIFTGKKLSLLGDSVSAYSGEIPSGNAAYYTGSNANVRAASEMWYNVLCNELGMSPLVINAWSGSAITQLEDSDHSSITPMSDNSRCSALNNGTTIPDIIIIAGGLNDYTYAMSAQSEPLQWDTTSAPTEGNNFTETYACMIKKLQTNYPNALIVALSSFFSMRGTDNGYTLTHTVSATNNTWTQQDYNESIEQVCKQMHIPFIDVSKVGFNRNNYYPNFAQDSSSTPTHPNKFGHAAIGLFVADQLLGIARAIETAWLTRS